MIFVGLSTPVRVRFGAAQPAYAVLGGSVRQRTALLALLGAIATSWGGPMYGEEGRERKAAPSIDEQAALDEAVERAGAAIDEKLRTSTPPGDDAAMRERIRESLDLLDAIPGSGEHDAANRRRWNLAVAADRVGDPRLALSVFERLRPIYEAHHPEGPLRTLILRANIASLYVRTGRAREARDEMKAVLSEAPAHATDASLERQRFRLDYARTLLLAEPPDPVAAVDVLAEAFEKCAAMDFAADGFGAFFHSVRKGLLSFVRTHREKVVAAYEAALRRASGASPLADEIALAIESDLIRIRMEIEDFGAALVHARHVVETLERRFPGRRAERLTARAELIGILVNADHLGEAGALSEELLAEIDAAGDAYPAHVVARVRPMARNALAVSVSSRGEYERAVSLFGSLLDEMVARGASAEELDPLRLNLLQALAGAGRLDEAIAHGEAVHESRSKLPPGDPQRVRIAEQMVLLHARRGDLAARDYARRQALDALEFVRSSAAEHSPRELDVLSFQVLRKLGGVLAVAGAVGEWKPDAELEALAFSAIESLRCLRARSERAARWRVWSVDDPEGRELLRLVDAAATRIASLARDTSADQRDLVSAIAERDLAERALRSRVGSAELDVVDLDSVIRALPSRTAVVAYHGTYLREYPAGSQTELRLVAHVVSVDGTLSRHDLGEVSVIDEAIDAWLGLLGTATGHRGLGTIAPSARAKGVVEAERDAARAVRRLVLDPLLERLAGSRTLVVLPDGALFSAPFDAFPVDADAGAGWSFLGDDLRVVLVTSLHEFVESSRSTGSVDRLLVVGGVDYDSDEPTDAGRDLALALRRADGAARAEAPVVREPPLGEDGGAMVFRPLPGTIREARAVRDLFRESGRSPDDGSRLGGRTVTFLEARAATVEAFRVLAPEARWIHLATHGFVDVRAFASSARSSGAPTSVVDVYDARGLSLAALSGLAFAGVNRTDRDAAGGRRGLLSAEELSVLDLSACRLVVLSACETGAGFEGGGQGVASLQQAAYAAGAGACLASLWPVDDAAAARLMKEFYLRLWTEGQSAADALRAAKAVLRASGSTVREWAGWVVRGRAALDAPRRDR